MNVCKIGTLSLPCPRQKFEHIGLHCFESAGVIRKMLGAEVSFEALQQIGAFGFAGAFEGDAMIYVRRMGCDSSEIRAAQAFQSRQGLPRKLVNQKQILRCAQDDK